MPERPVHHPRTKRNAHEKTGHPHQKHSEIQAAIEYIDLKQDFYDEVLSGKIEYFSNLVGEE